MLCKMCYHFVIVDFSKDAIFAYYLIKVFVNDECDNTLMGQEVELDMECH